MLLTYLTIGEINDLWWSESISYELRSLIGLQGSASVFLEGLDSAVRSSMRKIISTVFNEQWIHVLHRHQRGSEICKNKDFMKMSFLLDNSLPRIILGIDVALKLISSIFRWKSFSPSIRFSWVVDLDGTSRVWLRCSRPMGCCFCTSAIFTSTIVTSIVFLRASFRLRITSALCLRRTTCNFLGSPSVPAPARMLFE